MKYNPELSTRLPRSVYGRNVPFEMITSSLLSRYICPWTYVWPTRLVVNLVVPFTLSVAPEFVTATFSSRIEDDPLTTIPHV